jgi:Tol biopolymer transport system component
MLTGQRLFTGDSIAHILADVLRAPIDFDKLPSATPRVIRELVKRCLDRDAKTRLRDIGEVRIAIQNLGKEPEVAANTASPSRARWLAWVAAVFFFITAAVLAAVHFRERPPEVHSITATLLPPDGAEFDFNQPFALPALSPDGSLVVFGARSKENKRQLWLRRLDSSAAQPLAGTEGAGYPFWSPDSRWVGFSQENKLKKIDIRGGPPVAITDFPSGGGLRGASWSSTGVIIFGVVGRGNALFRVAAAGGAASAITTLEQGKEFSHVHPWFLPDGTHFLYQTREVGDSRIRLGSLDEPGKPGKVVGRAQSNAVYALGHLLYLRQNTLMAQPFDLGRLETGEATPLVEGVSVFDVDAGGFTVSASGLLLYQSGTIGNQSRLLWRDRQGKALGNLGDATGAINSLMLSPDGKRLAASVTDRSGNIDLWIYDTVRGSATRFTFDPATDRAPVWSPDGSTVYFHSNRRGHFSIFRKAADGSGTEQMLQIGGGDTRNDSDQSVSPDGKLLLFFREAEKTGNDLWVVPLMPEQNRLKPEPRIFLQTPFEETFAKFSPDGRWVTYQSNESGQIEVYAAPFPGPGGKRLISIGGGNHPRWRPDGKELFYATPDGQLMAVEVSARNETLEVGRVQRLFGGIITSGGSSYDVSTDGQKFVVVDGGASSVLPVTLLQNWPAALRK